MPRILINEVDNTSAGTPGRYGNYAVLITGYVGTPEADKGNVLSPDENGVYEFSSEGDFLATIGESDIARKDLQTDKVKEYHYGNRMAKELLKLGYTVIYKVINNVSDMNSEKFWEIFKDKASYDFRFVSHGLLETCYDQKGHADLYARLVELKEDAKKFEGISNDADYQKTIKDKADGGEGYTGFKDSNGLQYGNYESASEYLKADDEGIVPAVAAHEALIDEHNAKHVTPEVFNSINGKIADLACYRSDDVSGVPGRGDCIALIELDEDIYCEANPDVRPEQLIVEGINGLTNITNDNGKYCAMTVPSVFYKINGEAVKFPGAFHYLACFMNSLRSGFAEWYAAAGYNRGVSSYVVDHTSVKLGEIAINALEPRNIKDQKNQPKFACNVIANFRGSYYLWGNRTAAELGSADGGADLTAHHFLNIRQLCTTIKKQLYVACRRFTFDPNSDTLWFNFVNAITPTLDAMKADQGIRDYKVVKVFTDKKATLKARVRIIPIEAVEDFDIEVSLEDSFGGVSVTAEG